MMEVEIDKSRVSEGEDIQTCERCSHYSICFIRINISEFMTQRFPDEKPFEVSDLAKICRKYDPILRVRFER